MLPNRVKLIMMVKALNVGTTNYEGQGSFLMTVNVPNEDKYCIIRATTLKG